MGDLVRKIERGALALLVAVAAFYIHQYDKERSLREVAEIAAHGLPADVLAKYTLENNKLITMVKNAQGKTEVRTIYVPDEGRIEVITKDRDAAVRRYNELLERLKVAKSTADVAAIVGEMGEITQDLNRPPEYAAKTKGFTSRFGFGIAITPGHSLRFATGDGTMSIPMTPALDWKWGYWGRYSGLLQVNAFYPGPMVSRHIDDITPRWLHMNNLELGVSAGPGWTGGWGVGTHLRSNF